MGRKVRKQLNIGEEQDRALKREAERLGVSESEVVRRVLGAWTASGRLAGEEPPIERMRALRRKLDERRAAVGSGKPYEWNRTDAYEDQLERTVGKRHAGR